MATRFYFDDNVFWDGGGSNPANPAYSAGWTETNAALRVSLKTTKPGNAFSQMTIQKNVATNPDYGLMRVYVSDTLAAGFTLTGTVRGQFLCQEQNAANEASRALIIRVCDSTCTTFRTPVVLDHRPGAKTSEYNDVGATNRNFPPATAISPVVIQAGDRIVVEIGTAYYTAASGAGTTTTLRTGNPAASGDLPVDEVYTTPELAAWIEFSLDFTGVADDYLMTLSGPSEAQRPAAPSKRGLHYFLVDTDIETIWDGSAWKEMVSSLNANGGTGVGGNLTFQNTTDIDVTLTGTTFTWNAQALSAEADRTKTMVLTDSGTGGLLTFSSAFPAGEAQFKLPGAGSFFLQDSGTVASFVASSLVPGDLRFFADPVGSPVSINTRGHLGTAGTLASANRILTFQAFYADSTILTAIHATASNSGTGGTTGVNLNVTNSGANAVINLGTDLTLSMTGASTTGAAAGHRVTLSFSGGAAHVTTDGFNLGATSLTNAGTITAYRGFIFNSPTGGTATNVNAFQSSSISTGTTRRGFFFQGATTGTPTAVLGVDILSISVGTDRWAVRGANKIENTATDIIASTAGKGFITKDTQGTARFWRKYMDATGTVGVTVEVDENDYTFTARGATPTGSVLFKLDDVGTALPTT